MEEKESETTSGRGAHLPTHRLLPPLGVLADLLPSLTLEKIYGLISVALGPKTPYSLAFNEFPSVETLSWPINSVSWLYLLRLFCELQLVVQRSSNCYYLFSTSNVFFTDVWE